MSTKDMQDLVLHRARTLKLRSRWAEWLALAGVAAYFALTGAWTSAALVLVTLAIGMLAIFFIGTPDTAACRQAREELEKRLRRDHSEDCAAHAVLREVSSALSALVDDMAWDRSHDPDADPADALTGALTYYRSLLGSDRSLAEHWAIQSALVYFEYDVDDLDELDRRAEWAFATFVLERARSGIEAMARKLRTDHERYENQLAGLAGVTIG